MSRPCILIHVSLLHCLTGSHHLTSWLHELTACRVASRQWCNSRAATLCKCSQRQLLCYSHAALHKAAPPYIDWPDCWISRQSKVNRMFLKMMLLDVYHGNGKDIFLTNVTTFVMSVGKFNKRPVGASLFYLGHLGCCGQPICVGCD